MADREAVPDVERNGDPVAAMAFDRALDEAWVFEGGRAEHDPIRSSG